MAQHGRRTLRLKRLVDGSPEGMEAEDGAYGYASSRLGGISPPLLKGNGAGFSDVDNSAIHTSWDNNTSQDHLIRRLQVIEDKSILTDTASRHAVEEGDRIRNRLVDFESNNTKQLETLSNANKRDIDLLREWVSSFIEGQVSDLEHQLRNSMRLESEALQQKIRLNYDKISTAQNRSEATTKTSFESSRKQTQDFTDKITSKIVNVDRAVQDLETKSAILESHFTDSIDVALSREQAGRERENLDILSQLQHLQSNLNTVQRDITGSVTKVSEALSISNERVNSLERFLKVEIKARMELSTSHDRLVDDFRKMERSHIAGVSQTQSYLQEKITEMSQQITNQTTTFKDNLSATSDACKKMISTEIRTCQSEIQNSLTSTIQSKLDIAEQTNTDVVNKVGRLMQRLDEAERSSHDLKRSQEREAAEAQSSITRSENKIDEQLQNVQQTLSDYCNNQVKNALEEMSHRESNLRDSTTNELKRVSESVYNQQKSHETDIVEVKRLINDNKNESNTNLDTNIDRVTALVQRTDELTRIQIDRNTEIYQNVEAIKSTAEDLQRQIKDEAHTTKKSIETTEQRIHSVELSQTDFVTNEDVGKMNELNNTRLSETEKSMREFVAENEQKISEQTDDKLRHILTENITNISTAVSKISEKQESSNKEARDYISTIEINLNHLKQSHDELNTLTSDNIGGLADLVGSVQKRMDTILDHQNKPDTNSTTNNNQESHEDIKNLINNIENKMEVVNQIVTDQSAKVDASFAKIELHTTLIDESRDTFRDQVDNLNLKCDESISSITQLKGEMGSLQEAVKSVSQQVIVSNNSSDFKSEMSQLKNDILLLSESCEDLASSNKVLSTSDQTRKEGDIRWLSWQEEIQSKLSEFYSNLTDIRTQVDSNQHDVDYNIGGLNERIQDITAKMLSFCEAEQVQLSRRISNPS